MAIVQSVKFDGKILATRFFDPQPGPVNAQVLRRQPFGLRGELELRGYPGGQVIAIPVHLVRGTLAGLRDSITSIKTHIGKHGKLTTAVSASSASAGSEDYGECTFDSMQEDRPRKVAYETTLNGPGWEMRVMLFFYQLNPTGE